MKKKVKLRVKKINFKTGGINVVVLNSKDAIEIGKAGDRVRLRKLDPNIKKSQIAILDIAHSDSSITSGEIGIFLDLMKEFKENEVVSVKPADPPDSFEYIQKKIKGKKLTSEEINSIIYDSVSGHLSSIELAAFITSVQINGMDTEEMTALTLSEARSGRIFDFGFKVFDKHSTYISI
ncbi:MAG: hypothetical protein ACTSR8_03850 [Promethearchaeota archaeon]